jgi:hypothetical protein
MDLLQREIGGELEQDRLVAHIDSIKGFPYGVQTLWGLKGAKARRIRRTHIDNEKISIGVKYLKGLFVIFVGFFEGCFFIFADVDTDDEAGGAFFQVLGDPHSPSVIEAHAVEQGIILGNPKEARFGIARLGAGRYGAHFYESKS